MALITCTLHRITYNDALDPTCPQCTMAGITGAAQIVAIPGKHGAPAQPTSAGPPGTEV